jgi:hypothetical protein
MMMATRRVPLVKRSPPAMFPAVGLGRRSTSNVPPRHVSSPTLLDDWQKVWSTERTSPVTVTAGVQLSATHGWKSRVRTVKPWLRVAITSGVMPPHESTDWICPNTVVLPGCAVLTAEQRPSVQLVVGTARQLGVPAETLVQRR